MQSMQQSNTGKVSKMKVLAGSIITKRPNNNVGVVVESILVTLVNSRWSVFSSVAKPVTLLARKRVKVNHV